MSFLDSLRKILAGGSTPGGATRGGGSTFGDDANIYWIYAQCRRCGEPLLGRVNLMNDPSQEEDDTWVVRKQLSGTGKNFCFQTVEVSLHFDAQKKRLLDAEATGGTIIDAEEYARLLEEQQAAAETGAAEAAAAEAAEGDTEAPPPSQGS